MTGLKNSQFLSLRERLQHLKSPIIIGVAGDSGSGKTTYSNGIRCLLGTELVETICTDGYHKEDREQRKKSGRLPLDPEANYLDLLATHLRTLKQNQAIEVPIYNHATGKLDPPLPFEDYEKVSATRFTQLLVAWRFLEQVNGIPAGNSAA